MLLQIILGLLQQQNNSGQSDENDPDNSGGRSGANAETAIINVEAQCLTDSLLASVDTLLKQAIEEGLAAGEEVANTIRAEQSSSSDGSSSTLDSIMTAAASIASLIGGGNPLTFVLTQKFGIFSQIFHTGGNATLDKSTREGCGLGRLYDTAFGAMGAGGGGSSSSRNSTESYANMGFGGMDKALESAEVNMIPCEEATSPPNYSKGRNGSVMSISVPSGESYAANNFINGIPNAVCGNQTR